MKTLSILSLALLSLTPAISWQTVENELQGVYCGKPENRINCCNGRLDDCSHQILGTLCYCDEFCIRNNTKHDDCCPDYRSVCGPANIEMTPPTPPPGTCVLGDTRRNNCNTCKCTLSNGYSSDWVCSHQECIINDRIISTVNSRRGWKASNYTQFWGRSLGEGIQFKLGTLPLSELTLNMRPDPSYSKDPKLPSSFDARYRWPSFISAVYDQGWCGSDWAVSTANVASDRFAIQSNGAENVRLSAQTLLCSQRGCKGGHVDSAWLFVRNKGLLDESCLPYTGKTTRKACPKFSETLTGAGCPPAKSGRQERYRTSPVKRLGSLDNIMYEIYTSGPVQAVMTVRQDFFSYRTGVYRHVPTTNNNVSGLHSVRIVGWGEDNGDKYWSVANSWGTEWGERGYFRIARGENESDIEKFVLSTLADVYEANTIASM